MLFHNLKEFANNVAIYNASTQSSLTYNDLHELVCEKIARLGLERQLVFIEMTNTIESISNYIACCLSNKVLHLVEDLYSLKTQSLIELYQPNITINNLGIIQHISKKQHEMHKNLFLLMSTSGSTGTPKFVKLSYENLASNAESIIEYLGLTQSERAFAHLKLHYSYGLSILNSHLSCGASLVLTDENITSPIFWQHLKASKASSFPGVPYTYETLLHSSFQIDDYPHLKSFNQAGGKLESSIIDKLLKILNGKAEFIIMYGQTEAAPRISYLPPSMVFKHSDTIGIAIPGGILKLFDKNHQEINEYNVEGELVYQGTNVMLGYATSSNDLKSDETPEYLLTGDVALRTPENLFKVIGRSKRFVKPFGMRVNLDDIQSYVKEFYSKVAVVGQDNNIMIAYEAGDAVPKDFEKELIIKLSQKYDLPQSLFSMRVYETLPLLTSGKIDFQKIMSDMNSFELPNVSLWKGFKNWVIKTLEFNDSVTYSSVLEMYCDCLKNNNIKSSQSFDNLEIDSLSFVAISLGIEQLLGIHLPNNWKSLSIEQLETIRLKYISE